MNTRQVIVALLAVAPLCAQTDSQRERHRKHVEEQIRKMRKALADDLPVRSNVRVKVLLRNGNKLQGVVRNGRFVERPSGLDFVAADKQTLGAGIRVWYYDNTTSYIFLPFRRIVSYKIGQRLTNVEVKQIEARIKRERAQIEAKRKAAVARRNAVRDKNASDKDASDKLDKLVEGADQNEVSPEDKQLLALLDEFPPDAGWGADKLREIQAKKINLGVFPDQQSKRFIEVYEDWQKAVKVAEKVAKAEQETPAKGDEGEKGDDEESAPSKRGYGKPSYHKRGYGKPSYHKKADAKPDK